MIDLWVGVFVAAGFAGLLFRAQGGQPRLLHQPDLPGRGQVRQHRRPQGARPGEERAGVVVGRVAGIRFDTESYEAIVSMTIDLSYQFPRDTAKIDLGHPGASSTWGSRRAATA